MAQVSCIEEFAVTRTFSAVYTDDEDNEYTVTINEYNNNDTGDFYCEVVWVDDTPDGVDDDDVISMFYDGLEQLSNNTNE